MTINGDFTFDGVSMSSLGDVTVVKGETFEAPAREFDVREIPGRNGGMVLDGGKYPNVEVTYWVMIRSDFNATYRKVCGFLLSRKGYCRLSDSWNTDEFYLAYVAQPIQPTVNRGEDQGAFEVVFSRKPQRFLVSGETGVEPSGGLVHLENPTYFPSRPQISVTLAQDLSAAAETLFECGLFTQVTSSFSQHVVEGTRRAVVLYAGFQVSMGGYGETGDEIVVDCEARSVYNKTKNRSLNAITYLVDSNGTPTSDGRIFYPDFPEIQPILATDYVNFTIMFTYASHYSAMSVLPRWWTV